MSEENIQQLKKENMVEGGTAYHTFPPEDPRTLEDRGVTKDPEWVLLADVRGVLSDLTHKPCFGPYGEFGDMVRIRDEMDALDKLLSSKRHSRARKQVKLHFARIAQLALNAYLT